MNLWNHLLNILLLTVYLYSIAFSSSLRLLLFASLAVLRKSRVVLPRWHLMLKLDPYWRSNLACSTLPFRHASCNNVIPSLCCESSGNRASGSAPSLSRNYMRLRSSCSADVIRQVRFVYGSTSFTSSAPLSFSRNSRKWASFEEKSSKHALKLRPPKEAPWARKAPARSVLGLHNIRGRDSGPWPTTGVLIALYRSYPLALSLFDLASFSKSSGFCFFAILWKIFVPVLGSM